MIATKFFCRATLRASAVLAVGPVFLSHSFIKAPKDITKLFSRLGSPVIAVFFDSIRHYTIPRVTRNWFWIVMANSTNTFKHRLDIYWQDQEIIYDFHAQLQGTGSRSEVFRYN